MRYELKLVGPRQQGRSQCASDEHVIGRDVLAAIANVKSAQENLGLEVQQRTDRLPPVTVRIVRGDAE